MSDPVQVADGLWTRLIPHPRRGIGLPRPQRPGTRYPLPQHRLPGTWSR
ncbi:hypothetical protein ACH4MN_36370 [Streptomyces anulatus]